MVMLSDIHGPFLAAQAAQLSGLTTTMVDYLCRQGIIIPSAVHKPGRGRRRLYSFGDVVMLRAIGRLLATGLSVERMKRGLEKLRSLHPEITATTLPGRFLMSDGHDLFFRANVSELENLSASGQLAFGFLLEFERVRDEVLGLLATSAAS